MHFNNILSITSYGFASEGRWDHNFTETKNITENYYRLYIIVCIQRNSTFNTTAFSNAKPFVWQKCWEERDASTPKAESLTRLLRTRGQQVRLKRRYNTTKQRDVRIQETSLLNAVRTGSFIF
jgi:hypothetical protein